MLGKKRFARLRSLLTQLNYATKQKIGQKKQVLTCWKNYVWVTNNFRSPLVLANNSVFFYSKIDQNETKKRIICSVARIFLLKYKVHKGKHEKHENHNKSINKSHFANTEETHTDTKKKHETSNKINN